MTCPVSARIGDAKTADVETLCELITEHAAFEGRRMDPVALKARMMLELASSSPRVIVRILKLGAEAAGYASMTVDFSTMDMAPFLHMDCLYVRETRRGAGLGALLIEDVFQHARTHGVDRVEWQTPAWNLRAAAFYEAHGAVALPKQRFSRQIKRL